MIESSNPQIMDVIVSYPSFVRRHHKGIPCRTEAIAQARVLDWAEIHSVPVDLVNPHGATHAIYILAPVGPEQEMLVRLRWS